MSNIYVPKLYQQKAYDWVMEHDQSGLFLDMGLGKTVITLTCINQLMYRDAVVNKCIVVAPKKVIQFTWQQEAAKWQHTKHLKFSVISGTLKQRLKALNTPADIYLINREQVSWLCAHFGGCSLPFDMLVIDESSSFKNHSSKRFKALAKASMFIPYKIILTGTPAPKGYINLWSQIYLLDGGNRLGKTITQYRQKYFSAKHPLPNGVVPGYEVKPEYVNTIKHLISDICVSMQAKDLIQLPPLHFVDHEISLPADVQAKYDEFERDSILEMVDSGVEITAMSAAALTGKLLQFSNGAIYYTSEEGNPKEYLTLHDEKINKLIDIIEDANGKSVLVAYSYMHDLERLLDALKKYDPRQLKGEQDMKDWNEGKINVMLVHPASAGHGLNMQDGGAIAVWFGLTFDLELYDQFNARLHRTGQKYPVFIHHLLCTNTEDKRVLKVLNSKGDVQQGIMDSIKAKIDRFTNFFKK